MRALLDDVPYGARMALRDLLNLRIEKLRDGLEEARNEKDMNRAQGAIAELRDIIRKLEQ